MMRSAFDHEDLRVYQSAIGFMAWLEEDASGITSKESGGTIVAQNRKQRTRTPTRTRKSLLHNQGA